jgi:hypothetical protein
MRTSLFHRVESRHSPRGAGALPRLRRGPIRAKDAEPKTISGEQPPRAAGQGTASEQTASQAAPANAANAATGHTATAYTAAAHTALDRAQAAGGPLDLATYVCGCGLLFSALVSTTVCCPHCGAEQDW